MSTPEQEHQGDAAPPGEEEMRAAYEAELARISATDMILQVSVSLLNLGARRLAPGGEPGAGGGRDLEQVRDAIDAARALMVILERRIPQEVAPLRDALSQLQMAYAREVSAAPAAAEQQAPADPGGGPATPTDGEAGAGGQPGSEQDQRRPGPAESSGRLWVPGS